MNLPVGTILTPNKLYSGLWALPRPTTKHWGSGVLLSRIEQVWGKCDVIFGKQDNVDGFTIDINPDVKPSIVCDWSLLPFSDRYFERGYWDPPYLGFIGRNRDVHYSRMENCYKEICRVVRRLLILSPLIYPCPNRWKRIAVIAITMGPNKIIRALQGFERD